MIAARAAFGLACLLSAGAALGQGVLDERLRGQLDNAPVTLDIACGPTHEAPCAKILPAIGAKTGPSGVLVAAAPPVPFPQAFLDVCEARAAAAILPRDALTRGKPCAGGVEVLARLFPLYGLLIVPAASGFRSLDDLKGGGAPILVDVNGEAMWSSLSLSRQPWTRAIDVTDGGFEDALRRVATGAAGAFFTVAPLEGGVVTWARGARDVNGGPRYAIIDARMGGLPCFYRHAALDFGGPRPVATMSEDAVLVLGRGFRDAHARGGPPVSAVLPSAIEAARDTIQSTMNVAREWRAAGDSCH